MSLFLRVASPLTPTGPARNRDPSCPVYPGHSMPRALDRPVTCHLMGLAGSRQAAWLMSKKRDLLGNLCLSRGSRTKTRDPPASRHPLCLFSITAGRSLVDLLLGAPQHSLAFPGGTGCGLHSGAALGKWHPLCSSCLPCLLKMVTS